MLLVPCCMTRFFSAETIRIPLTDLCHMRKEKNRKEGNSTADIKEAFLYDPFMQNINKLRER